MAIRNKPALFHCQVMVWSKDSPSGAFKRGYVIDAVRREHSLAIYESKQTFLRKQLEGDPRLSGKSFESHMWTVNLIDVGRNLAYRKLLQPLTRPPNVLDPEFNAPDESDRIVKVGERKWFFDFNLLHLRDLAEDGEIDLTRLQSSAILKRTDNVQEEFSWLN